MSYIANNLLKNEKLLYETRRHWIIFFLPVFFTFLAFVCLQHNKLLILLGYLLTAVAVVYWFTSITAYLTSEYGVTNKRVLVKLGFIKRQSLETLLTQIAGITVNQGLIGRMLDYGTIIIQGTGGAKDKFYLIDNPLLFRRKVQEQIEQVIVKTRRHQASEEIR